MENDESKQKKKAKKEKRIATLTDGFFDLFGELIFGFLAIGIGLGIAMLFPHDALENIDFELFFLIGSVVLILIVIAALAVIRLFTRRVEEKNMKLIYDYFGGAEELTLIYVSKKIGEKTVNLPVIRGYCEKGRFEVMQNKNNFIFSIEYSGKEEEEKYAEETAADINSAIKFIENFIAKQ